MISLFFGVKLTLVAFRMANKGVVYGFIHILILIQIGDSLNPDDRITGLEKELSIVKTDLDLLKSQVRPLVRTP